MRAATAEALMREAIATAQQAALLGERPIGALIVGHDGCSVLARTCPVLLRPGAADPTGHATVQALRVAGRLRGSRDLSGCHLITTLQPCPMCTAAAVLANLASNADAHRYTDWRRLDHDPHQLVSRAGMQLHRGVLRPECVRLLTAAPRQRSVNAAGRSR